MVNLVITNACNLACPFCFASEYLADGAADAERMSLEQFRRHVAWAGGDTVRFCGGEPTVHPDFLELLALALDQDGRRAFIMTNGVWPDAVRRRLAELPTGQAVRITYLFNVLEPAFYTAAQAHMLDQTLAAPNPLAITLGLTLHRADQDVDHVFHRARRHGIRRIRYSVASPNATDPGSWLLDARRDFPALAALVHRVVMEGRARGLTVHSDCGYIPPCLFTDAQRRDLETPHPSAPGPAYTCNGPVDLGPTGEAWRCYGLYSVVRAHTREHADAASLHDAFERRAHELGDANLLFDECAACDWRARGQCAGGCYALRVTATARQHASGAGVDLADDESLRAAVPRLNAGAFHVTGGRLPVLMVREDGAWAPLDASPVEERLLGCCDGVRDVGALAVELARGLGRAVPVPEVARALRRLQGRGVVGWVAAPGRGPLA
ncbi:MAG: radical SAM protein [Deltaproteobacteria bacterium]|nr:radical SAM protein [Deltaproteobacteria bacterium]